MLWLLVQYQNALFWKGLGERSSREFLFRKCAPIYQNLIYGNIFKSFVHLVMKKYFWNVFADTNLTSWNVSNVFSP